MDVVSICPLPVASLLWQRRPSAWILTVVCKATFLLRPGESTLAPEQEAPNEYDNYWNDDDRRSLHAASDFAPQKPRVDIVLVGQAYAPGRQPVRSLSTRLRVGEVDKVVEVFCDRSLAIDGSIQEGAPFARTPLVYERAAGGPKTSNPVGMRRDARDAYGRVALPNLQPPGLGAISSVDQIGPIGFGPIAPGWPARRVKLGQHAASWSDHDWFERSPLPDDLDPAYFNIAPSDQQSSSLREDERLVLENLHQDHPHLITTLPGISPRAHLEGRGPAQPLTMRGDTLWIDTDRGLCTLTWRGQVSLERRDEPGRVVVAIDQGGAPMQGGRRPTWTGADRAAKGAPGAPPPAAPLQPTMFLAPEELQEEMPEERSNDAIVGTILLGPLHEAPATLPFSPLPAPPPPPSNQSGGGLPFAGPPPGPSKLSQSSSEWGPSPVPPPLIRPVIPAEPIATPVGQSPWAGGTPAAVAPPAALADFRPMSAITGGDSNDLSRGSALAASNAAAAAGNAAIAFPAITTPVAAPRQAAAPAAIPMPRLDAGSVLHLIWFDPESVPRVRRKAEWRKILEDFEERPLDREIDDPALAREPMDVEDRREIFEILAQGEPIDDQGLNEALSGAVREGGKFVPPLVLAAGELRFDFDELETLKATMASASPFMGGDEVLAKAIQDARDFLGIPNLLCPPAVADGLTRRIEEAFKGVVRRSAAPADYLVEQRERVLLTGRCYQRREVFGGRFLRAGLQVGGSSRVVTAYLPEDLAKKLPMFEKFKVKAIGELCLSEDRYEAASTAFKVLVLGRVASAPGRR